MNKRKIRCRKSLIHLVAKCVHCDWISEDYLKGQRQIREHIKRTGHKVKVELGYYGEYEVWH